MMGLKPETDDAIRARNAALVAGVESRILALAGRTAARYRVDCAEDLAQIGRLAALRTAMTWREDGGCSFYTYSYLRIRHEIEREARRLFCLIQIPYARRFTHAASCVSLDAPVGDPEDGETVADILACETEDVTRTADSTTLRDVLERLLARLKPRYRDIMKLRFFEGKSQPEIARSLNVSRQRIWQIEQETLRLWRNTPEIRSLREATV